jgi:BirA family biotin operon repressor/biotin-[acetyl-CoA-carboxylase] ligase
MTDELRADRLLALLARGPVQAGPTSAEEEFSGPRLMRAAAVLETRGYTIERTGDAYRLAGAQDLLLAERIEPVLRGCRLGTPLFTYGRLGSTNELAAHLASADAPEGTLVTAEEQTRGRGRQGKTWHSPPGVGLWMSLVLRPAFEPRRAAGVPLLGALAVAEGIRRVTGTSPEIKWPNDVFLGGRKLAGVLGESAVEGNRVRFAVLGMGVNVNLPATNLPIDLRGTAGSLLSMTGRTWDRVELLAAILSGLEARYDAYADGGFEAIKEEFLLASNLVGRCVEILYPNASVSGTVLDVAADGELVLATLRGTSRIRVGEGSLVMR